MTEKEARAFGEAAEALEKAAAKVISCKTKDLTKAYAKLRIARKNLRRTVDGLLIDAYTEGTERALEG
jgi:hypothetical protein